GNGAVAALGGAHGRGHGAAGAHQDDERILRAGDGRQVGARLHQVVDVVAHGKDAVGEGVQEVEGTAGGGGGPDAIGGWRVGDLQLDVRIGRPDLGGDGGDLLLGGGLE